MQKKWGERVTTMLGLNHLRRHMERRMNQAINLTNVQSIVDFNTLTCAEKREAMLAAARLFNTLANAAINHDNERRIGHELINIALYGAPDKTQTFIEWNAASYVEFIYRSFTTVNLDRHEVEREFCRYFRQNLEYHLSVN